jgi:predicted ATPase
MLIRRLIPKEEGKRINLKVKVKDFGPISDGEITIKPLTIFIGPNNSGKSYAAVLIHSLFESLTSSIPFGFFFKFLGESGIEYYSEYIDELNKIVKGIEKKSGVDIPRQFVEKIFKQSLEKIFEKTLSKEIARSYACPLNELIRIDKSSFKLEIYYDSFQPPFNISLVYNKNDEEIKIEKLPQVDIKVKINIVEPQQVPFTKSTRGVKISGNEIQFYLTKGKEIRKEILFEIVEVTLDFIYNKLRSLAMPSYYLPAARSGILQGHRALAAGIIRRIPYVGIEKLPEIPPFSGVVSDFISSILNLPERKGTFYELAQEFEEEIIKGEVVVRPFEEYHGPDIKYKFKDTEIPLHRSSSTVSELAPLFLYLKYHIEPGNILIIEEPEAHLHPQNQLILAKFLVRMIRKGIYVIITTHSEFLLEKLSNFIMLSKIEPGERKKRYKYSDNDFLKLDDVSVHVFGYDEKSKGYKINKLEITEEDGIPQEEFLKVHEVLYEETFKIQKDLNAET